MNREFSLGGRVRSLRTMSAEEFSKLPTGQTGATLEAVVDHAHNVYGGHDIVGEEFIESLRADHNKIRELMSHLGETRDEVSIVARTADGGFTRMLLHKDADGHYKETKKDVDTEHSSDKRKTHRQDNDLFIFEKGVKAMAA